ncbi:MAG: response regulator transcription factor [Oscillospiraceae bacterium]|nr:response regulator transcription factor [Oscillospiraceae bacterium]
MEKLLLVEDDLTLIRMLRSFLEGEGFCTVTATGQTVALEQMVAAQPDLALVDISLAEGNGFAVCAEAKRLGIPVIFLTASGDEYSVVAGLDMGADDYIAKPFRPRELVSRIRSVLRRTGKGRRVVTLRDLTVDTEKATVTKAGEELFLSALEYRLLLVFLNSRGKILSRSRLLEEIWDSAGDFVSDNTLTVYIKRLRDKIETDPAQPDLIKTVRGLGYRLEG